MLQRVELLRARLASPRLNNSNCRHARAPWRQDQALRRHIRLHSRRRRARLHSRRSLPRITATLFARSNAGRPTGSRGTIRLHLGNSRGPCRRRLRRDKRTEAMLTQPRRSRSKPTSNSRRRLASRSCRRRACCSNASSRSKTRIRSSWPASRARSRKTTNSRGCVRPISSCHVTETLTRRGNMCSASKRPSATSNRLTARTGRCSFRSRKTARPSHDSQPTRVASSRRRQTCRTCTGRTKTRCKN